MNAERMSDPFQEAARVAVEKIKDSYDGLAFADQTILEAFAPIRAEYEALRELEQLTKLAYGEHNRPGDCFATGPRTGDAFLDYVACPGCAVIQQLEKLDALRRKESL